MSSNTPQNIEEKPISYTPKSETSPDKKKLSLSHSEIAFDNQKGAKRKLLGKVKSWSSKDHHFEDKAVSVELDLARSLTRLEVTESNEVLIGSNLLRARDSLENLLKDEQNMPKSSLEKSILHPKPRQISGSPKSSPQLGETWKASSSKDQYWDPYERQGKKNRKDIKKKSKGKHNQQTRGEGTSMSVEGKTNSTVTSKEAASGETPANEEASVMEEEGTYTYKYLPKNSKSVVFTNEVLVVYFNNDDVVGEEKEPLKKEVEQQNRNKEMRRVHLTKTQEKYNLCLF